MKMRRGDAMVDMDVLPQGVEDHLLLMVTKQGFGKRVRASEFRSQRRGGMGVTTIKFKNDNDQLACMRVCPTGSEVSVGLCDSCVPKRTRILCAGTSHYAKRNHRAATG
jgi:DNA gyrase subunit A